MHTNSNIGLVLSGGGGRGSYEVGVLKYLKEKHIIPDTIAGTSVGAINAAALASGFSIDDLENFWLMIRQKNIFRYSLWNNIKGFFKAGFTPFLDTSPLKRFLEKELDLKAIRNSNLKLYIPAVNIRTGEMEVFTNKELTIDHIMASAAIPMAFPHITIGENNHYWDGGLGMNTPISPLINNNIKNIYCILLSPRGGENYPLPKNRKEAFQRILDMALMGSFEAIFNSLNPRKLSEGEYEIRNPNDKQIRVFIIQPRKTLGVYSFFNFSKEQAKSFIEEGYNDAQHFINLKN